MNIDSYCVLGVDREFDLTEERLLQAMDTAKVDRAVIAPPDRYLAVFNREGNDMMLAAGSKHSERFIPACTVNPWYGAQGIDELTRAVAEGARMLVLHPCVQGYQANDELVWPVLEAAMREKVPVYIHTGPPGSATPWQVVDLAERFPELDLIIGHCGATDFWNDMVEAGRAAPNAYFESSFARPFAFSRYVEEIGVRKGIVGSFAPLNELTFEWAQMRDVLPPEEFAPIYGENISRLLSKRGPL